MFKALLRIMYARRHFVIRERVLGLLQETERQRAHTACLATLERYFYLICFNAYLHEQVSTSLAARAGQHITSCTNRSAHH